MCLPGPVLEEIASVVQRRAPVSTLPGARHPNLAVDESFTHDGLSGWDLKRVRATTRTGGRASSVDFIVKRWDPSTGRAQLAGAGVPLECLLHEGGHIDRINSMSGLHVPTVGSLRVGSDAWIIMDDVSADLAAWKTSVVEPGGPLWRLSSTGMPVLRELLDRLARHHVAWEAAKGAAHLGTVESRLVSQETRLRSFERLFREWFGSTAADPGEPEALRRAKERFTSARREKHAAFLDRLPPGERATWSRCMQYRDRLVAAASDLPVTLLHGDLVWRNIGVRRTGPETVFVMVDWELACRGNAALDACHMLFQPVLGAADRDGLLQQYYERYQFHGGHRMDARLWKRAVDVAIALDGVCWLPNKIDWVRRTGDSKAAVDMDALVERTNRALHDIAQ